MRFMPESIIRSYSTQINEGPTAVLPLILRQINKELLRNLSHTVFRVYLNCLLEVAKTKYTLNWQNREKKRNSVFYDNSAKFLQLVCVFCNSVEYRHRSVKIKEFLFVCNLQYQQTGLSAVCWGHAFNNARVQYGTDLQVNIFRIFLLLNIGITQKKRPLFFFFWYFFMRGI